MATSENQVPPAPDVVGHAFVEQYYYMLHESPQHVHRFYQDISKLGRPEPDGTIGITTTMAEIDKKILSLDYSELSAEILSVDAQESFGGGVIVLVTGFMIGKDNIKQKFTQCFFLAPQEKGYFVLNDIFRYVDENEIKEPDHDIGSPVSPDNVLDPPVLETQVPEQLSVTAEDGDKEELEVYNPENGQLSVEEEEAPVPEVLVEIPDDSQEVAGFDEIPDDSQKVAGLASQIEEVPKKSYASILKVMKEAAAPSSVMTAASVRTSNKIQEQQSAAAPSPSSVPETNGSSISTNEGGNNQETEAEGYSIYLKGLPGNATHALVENVFKKFGPIKSGGVQVRKANGFHFGFVEFEVESAALRAIEASPIVISDRHVVVEEKRSTNRGYSRGHGNYGRSLSFRDEGARGHGNYGNSRSFGRADYNGRGDFNGRGDYNGRGDHNSRGDFNGRSDFNGRGEYGYRNGNRGGFSSRGGDGYQNQRNDHVGTNGGRMNRTGGSSVNSAPKSTTAPRVPASA